MHSKFAFPQTRHNLEFDSSVKGTRHDSISALPRSQSNTYIAMTMKHPIDNEGTDSSIFLLGFDHSKKKRQRRMSDDSGSSAIEKKSCNSNAASSVSYTSQNIINKTSSAKDSIADSPRMMALLSSLEALEDNEQRQSQRQWPHSSTITPPAIPLHPSVSTTQAAAVLLQQKQQQYSKMGPLIARPTIHSIEEHPPVQVPANQANTSTTSYTTTVHDESRDTPNQSRAIETIAMDTIKRAMAAATAPSTFENNNTSTYTAVNAAFEQHRMAGAAALAAVASNCGAVAGPSPAITSAIIGTQNQPLGSCLFPRIPSTAATNGSSAKYNAAHLNHMNRSIPTQGPSARQLAIYKAVHNDYKKIYKPLQRPPRLPTPHEALVIAAISTATPTASACR
jgi:hypothetical protein